MAAADPADLNLRRWLAALIAGLTPSVSVIDGGCRKELLVCAREEGVIALAYEHLSDSPDAPVALRDTFATAARDAAVAALLREAECRRVLSALAVAQIPVLLMKGSALAWWLYPSAHLRECCDIDLLFASRAQAMAAVQVLAQQGYALHHQPDDLSYELVCRRQSGSMCFDLDIHWRLVNAPLFAEMFDFQMLDAAAIPLPRLAPVARGLGPVHAFLHACIHRAVNLSLGMADSLKWLFDLHLLGRRMTASEWSALQEQCGKHGLSGVCADGIVAAADLFGPAAPESVLRALQQAGSGEMLDATRLHDWKYMQGRNLAALPLLRLRARWLWQRLFPPVAYLQMLYGAERGVASLWMRRAQSAIRRLRP